MSENNNTVWLFLKKFSDLVTVNNHHHKDQSNARKNISYKKLSQVTAQQEQPKNGPTNSSSEESTTENPHCLTDISSSTNNDFKTKKFIFSSNSNKKCSECRISQGDLDDDEDEDSSSDDDYYDESIIECGADEENSITRTTRK